MKKVAVIGSINVDTTIYVDNFPKKGETISSKKCDISIGGKGFNQALAIKKARGDVLLIGAIGSDENGKRVINKINECGLDNNLYISNNATGSAHILIDSKGDNKIIVIPASNDDVLIKNIDISLLDYADIIVLQNEIPLETNEYILSFYQNKVIVYNPSPLKIIDEKYYSSITYLIVNEVELSFFSKRVDNISKARELIDKGVKNVIVTLADKGSFLVNKDKVINVNAIKVDAIDTVAAGDTYLGYFVSGISKGLSLIDSLNLASKASAITVTKKGASESIPYLDEIK